MKLTAFSVGKSWTGMAGVANGAGEQRVFKSITFSREADWAMTRMKIWWLFALGATKKLIEILEMGNALH